MKKLSHIIDDGFLEELDIPVDYSDIRHEQLNKNELPSHVKSDITSEEIRAYLVMLAKHRSSKRKT